MSKRAVDNLQPSSAAPERRPVTAHEVARLAGVSQSAVSRTYTAGASVSAKTRSKVIVAAKQLGYHPNLVARSLITGRSRIIGVTVPGLSNPFYAAVLEALSIKFAALDYRVMLFTTNPEHSSDPVLDEILRYRVDALVLVASTLSSHLADECQQIGLPVLLLNRKTDSKTASSVTGENRDGARQIAAFLHAGGHRRYAYIAGLDSSSTNRDREQGYTEYLQSHGIAAPLRAVGNYTQPGAIAAARDLLGASDRPDAIFCANDQMALAAINVAATEFSLRVGHDVSIVGFDDTALAGWPLLGLTTYSQPLQTMVDHAVGIIIASLGSKQLPPVQQVVPGQLIVRESARVPQTGVELVDGVMVWSES